MLSDFSLVVVGTGWALSLSETAICSPRSIRATSYPPWSGGSVLCGQAGPVAGLCNYLSLNRESGCAPWLGNTTS